MQVCPHCGRQNPDEEAYCYSCGHILPSALADAERGTTSLLSDGLYDTLEPRRRWGTAYFDRQSKLRLHFRDSDAVMILDVDREIILGRAHSEPSVPLPDVDLSPHGALEKGVSRNHLALMRDHDTVVVSDMGSANSTYLNGQRLMPYEPRILRDNDELRLGRLVIRVSFT
ncbi:MAG: FHA domain-containing protein [Chloroflexota bacterium]